MSAALPARLCPAAGRVGLVQTSDCQGEDCEVCSGWLREDE